MKPASLSRTRALLAYDAVRARSLALAAPLSPEDQALQSMPDASPTKWHLAHTTWFFETLLLAPHVRGWQPLHPGWSQLFNSYYESLGERHPRPQRGLLSRPSLSEVLAYRTQVDAELQALIGTADDEAWTGIAPLLDLGLAHEEQHQELILTDILHAFSLNPLGPAYRPPHNMSGTSPEPAPAAPIEWQALGGGVVRMGHRGPGFAFDNEEPAHERLLPTFEIASRPVSAAEFIGFIEDGGYRQPALWLSDGWACVQAQSWQAPLHWRRAPDGWEHFTLHGWLPLEPAAAACHLSFFEACAYAEWAGARLPTEFEWEAWAAQHFLAEGLTAERLQHGELRPRATPQPGLSEVWEWTRSSYDPYPGFRPRPGAVGEYNGKFMVGQLVLRGGSFASPPGHVRPSYRNFFPPHARWQFSGLRLARDR